MMNTFILKMMAIILVIVSIASCQSKVMRANKQHYIATKHATNGKYGRAINALEKAIDLAPNNAYYVDIANIHLKQGHKKRAMKYINKIKCSDDCTPEQEASLMVWKGLFALNLSQRHAALSSPKAALEKMDLYGLEAPTLRSHAHCNLGAADILLQGLNGKPKEDATFSKVHKRDFKRAKWHFEKAIQFDSTNCTANFNLSVVNTVLGLPEDLWTYGYLSDTTYQSLALPVFDCYPPVVETNFDFDYSSLTKELKDADQLLLVLDISGSMSSYVAKKGKSGSRFELMKEATDYILTNLDSTTQTGAITVGGSCTTAPVAYSPIGSQPRGQLQAELASLYLNGGTPLTDRLVMAADMFDQNKKDQNKTILLFSDGIGGCNAYARDACQLGQLFNEKDINFYAFSLLLEQSSTALQYSVYQCLVNATDGLLLGVTEDNKTSDKTRTITTEPFSVPLVITDIAKTELSPFMENTMALDSISAAASR